MPRRQTQSHQRPNTLNLGASNPWIADLLASQDQYLKRESGDNINRVEALSDTTSASIDDDSFASTSSYYSLARTPTQADSYDQQSVPRSPGQIVSQLTDKANPQLKARHTQDPDRLSASNENTAGPVQQSSLTDQGASQREQGLQSSAPFGMSMSQTSGASRATGSGSSLTSSSIPQQPLQNQSAQQQEPQFNLQAPASSQTGMATIQQIGSLLNRVTDLAQNAQNSFLQGQHQQSSTYLSDLQQSLIEIGELGAQSLALVHERGQSFSGTLPMQRNPSQGHRRTMTDTPVKKRSFANSLEELDFSTFKTQRSDEDPIRPDGHVPSAPPQMPMSASGMSSGMQMPTPSHDIVQPPSAPPFMSSGSSEQSMSSFGPTHSIQTSLGSGTSQTQSDQYNASPVVPQGAFTFAQPQLSAIPSFEQSATSTPSTGTASLSYSDSQSRAPLTGADGQGQQFSMPPSPQDMPSNMEKAFDQMVADVTPQVEPRLRTHVSSRSLGGRIGLVDDDAVESGLLASERGMSGAIVPPELKAKLDMIFFSFLEKVCSDVNYCDRKGEHLHQILTAKKMNRATVASNTFKAFKFRIQAFTNAFHEEVERHLGNECVFKQTRAYLWTSNYIARFNESGVKEKSKGNHVWRVEARKNFEGRFEFREFKRKIIAPTQVAYHGLEWTWPLRIWDPQSPSTSIKAVFNCSNLPHWIRWKEGETSVLHGIPDASCPSTQITVEAHYVSRGQQQLVRLSATVDLQVMPLIEGPAQYPDASQSAMDEDQSYEDLKIKQAESVVADNNVAQVMSQISFPFTPPISSIGGRQMFFADGGNDSRGESTMSDLEVRQPLPTAPLPQSRDSMQPFEQIQQNQIRDLLARQERAAATMQLNMPPMRRKTTVQPGSQQQSDSQQFQQQQHHQSQDNGNTSMQTQMQSPMTSTPMQMGMSQAPLDGNMMQPSSASAVSSSALGSAMYGPNGSSMKSAQIPASSSNHPGLTLTPMSSLPQIASTLPQLSANSQNPMLSPAMPMGYDPIANEGARIHAMQMEQERQRQQVQNHNLQTDNGTQQQIHAFQQQASQQHAQGAFAPQQSQQALQYNQASPQDQMMSAQQQQQIRQMQMQQQQQQNM